MTLGIDRVSQAPHTKQVPNELIHKILIAILAECVHSVCMSPDVAFWEVNVTATISSVSFAFNEIMKEVSTKAFAISPREHNRNILPAVRDAMIFLRNMAIICRQPLQSVPTRQPLRSAQQSELIQGYSLYLSAMSLRNNAAQTSVYAVYIDAHDTILHSLQMAKNLCEKVQPREMSKFLTQAVTYDMLITQRAKSVVEARMELDSSLHKMLSTDLTANNDEQTLARDTIKTRIHEALRQIETSNDLNTANNWPFVVEEPYRTFQLPALVETVKNCGRLVLDLDEYDIRVRANALVDNWSSV